MAKVFYVDLVSNASMDIHPENTLSTFTNRLATPIVLDQAYEVSLNEIIYPLDFSQTVEIKYRLVVVITSPKLKKYYVGTEYTFKYDGSDKIQDIMASFTKEIEEKFPSIDFREAEKKRKPEKLEDVKIIEEKIVVAEVDAEGKKLDDETIKKEIEKKKAELKKKREEERKKKEEEDIKKITVTKKPGFFYDQNTQKIYVTAGRLSDNKELMVYFKDESFLGPLGFVRETYNKFFNTAAEDAKHYATYTPDLSGRSNLLFINTDIIEGHRVGGAMSMNLRTIPLSKGAFESVQYMSFTNEYFFPVRLSRIDSISISITDENGERIQFRSGRVFITLKFRPRPNLT